MSWTPATPEHIEFLRTHYYTPAQFALWEELQALNAEWAAVTAKRRAWMDAHMADFAKHPIGTEIYSRDGRYLGVVVEHYRFHAGRNAEYDYSMDIDSRTDRGSNTSSEVGGVESTADRANRLRREAHSLLWAKPAATYQPASTPSSVVEGVHP